MNNLITLVKTVDWGKNAQNFLIFAGADTIVALIALETQLVPLIHNPIGAVVSVVFINWLIDLIKKFLEAHRQMSL